MQTLNTKYKNLKKLKIFIKENNIKDSSRILLQVFTGVCNKQYILDMINDIKSLLPNINIIGSSTDGEIDNCHISSNKTILSFSIFEKTDIKVYSVEAKKSCLQTSKSLIKKIKNEDDAALGIVFVDGLHTNGESFLKAFDKYAKDLKIVGGLSADNAEFKQTYIFTQNGINQSGVVCAVLYNKDLIVNTNYSFGWESIGREFKITKAVENRVYSINGQTPVELYGKYLGEYIKDKLPTTGIEFPLIVKRGDRKVARAVIGKEDDGSLIFAGNLKKGDIVTFGYGNVEHIIKDAHKLYDETSKLEVESIFVYSCMAWRRLLESKIKIKLKPLSKIANVSGFFTYGEFLYISKEHCSKLGNETISIVTISEKKNIKKADIDVDFKYKHENFDTLHSLTHLIKQTTQELNDINNNLEIKISKKVKEVKNKNKILFQQSKMAAMGEMMGNIAHQWRQPLNILGALNCSLEIEYNNGTLDKEVLKSITSKNVETIKRMDQTIEDFRNFFKPDKIRKLFNIKDSLKTILKITEYSLINNNITININNIDDDIEMYGY
ncbi:MAG: FIST N-terminal domain-containing protein, partial [Campylobacterota bacterium]|nr:FIST N-terminal domain-containing protein [Campylobacterota bacterium]